MRHPPAGLPLSCWRDPFFLKRGDPSTGKEWTVLLASGLRGRGGAVLVFKSPRLLTGGPGLPLPLVCGGCRGVAWSGLGPAGVFNSFQGAAHRCTGLPAHTRSWRRRYLVSRRSGSNLYTRCRRPLASGKT